MATRKIMPEGELSALLPAQTPEELDHFLYTPAGGSKNSPVIVFLHGRGGVKKPDRRARAGRRSRQ